VFISQVNGLLLLVYLPNYPDHKAHTGDKRHKAHTGDKRQ